MARAAETQDAKIRRLERDNRILLDRDQNREEENQAPSDIEGSAGRVAGLIYGHKNMDVVRKAVHDLPNIPRLRPKKDPNGDPLGYRQAVYYVRNELMKLIDMLQVVGPYNAVMVRDRHRVGMFVYNHAGTLLRPEWDPIGQAARADLLGMVERVYFSVGFPHVIQTSQETEVQPVEAERKGFG